MSATVDIETETAIDVVSIPIQAVTIRDFAKDKRKLGVKDSTKYDQELNPEDSNLNGLKVLAKDIRKVVFKVIDGKAERIEDRHFR